MTNSEIFSQFNPSVTSNYPRTPIKVSGQTKPYPKDNVELSTKKKKSSTTVRLLVGGFLGTTIAILGSAALSLRANMKAATTLAKHIDFKPAKTIEEAKEFAMKNLGMKKCDVGNDLDIANWVNQGITELSNKFKGKAYLPDAVELMSDSHLKESPNTLAAMKHGLYNMDKEGFLHHTLYINPKAHSLDGLLDMVKESYIFKSMNLNENTIILPPFMRIDKEVIEILMQVLNTGKISQYQAYQLLAFNKTLATFYENPNVVLKDLYSQQTFVELVKNKAPNLFKNLDDVLKLSTEEQSKYLSILREELISQKVPFNKIPTASILSFKTSPFATIFHELGHTAHEKNAIFKYNSGKMHEGGKLFNLLKTPEAQETAAKVSWYAKTTPIEFVAEVFSGIISGNKYPDDVMSLYNKFGGPKISSAM